VESKSELIVIASAKAKPGKKKELEQALRDVAAPTRAQPGCVAFRVLRVKGTPSTVNGFERWASAAHGEYPGGAARHRRVRGG